MDPRKRLVKSSVRRMVSICGVHDVAIFVVRVMNFATFEIGKIVANTNTTPAVITTMDVDCAWWW